MMTSSSAGESRIDPPCASSPGRGYCSALLCKLMLMSFLSVITVVEVRHIHCVYGMYFMFLHVSVQQRRNKAVHLLLIYRRLFWLFGMI